MKHHGQAMQRLSTQAGSALLGALGAALAGLISFFLMQSMIFTAKEQVAKQISSSAYIHVLDSALNLAITGVKNRWCFSGSMLSDPMCTLVHPGSVERMIISQDTVKFAQTFMEPNVDYVGQITLSEIRRDVSIGQITTGHPLFTLAQMIPLEEISAITFVLKRVNQVNQLPRSREVLIDISVSFVSSNKTIERLKAESRVAVFPRELSTMALILPNDLFLGTGAPTTPYDSSLAGAVSGTGLTFMSPVLVNGDLHLPPTAAGNLPVYFTDRVFLGGVVRKNGTPFAPDNAGGPKNEVFSDRDGYSGLLGGIELEPSRDEGLDALGGVLPEVQLNTPIMSMCQERLMGRFELSVTDPMRTLVRPSGSLSNVTEFTLGHINDLYPQSGIPTRILRLTGNMNGSLMVGARPSGNDPVARVVVEVNGYNGVNAPHIFQAEMALTDAISLDLGGSSLRVILEPLFLDPNQPNEPEPNRFNIRLQPIGAIGTGLRPFPINPPPADQVAPQPLLQPYLRVTVEPFDYGYRSGLNQRTTSNLQDRTKLNGVLYEIQGNNLVRSVGAGPGVETWFGCPTMDGASTTCMDRLLSTTDPIALRRMIPVEGLSYAALDKACGRVKAVGNETGEYPAFGGADWSTSFADQAPTVWGFTEFDNSGTLQRGYNPGTLILDVNNSDWNPARAQFHIRARMRRCQVESTANFVAGFFVCDEFVVQSRSTPLVIVGTVIANKVTVSPDAISSGIQWRSIFHPQSIIDLRRAQILFALNTSNAKVACTEDENQPIWLPSLGAQMAFNYANCSPSVLRERADPFRWTSVDPDCGVPTTPVPGASYTCKRRVVRVNLKELSRNLSL